MLVAMVPVNVSLDIYTDAESAELVVRRRVLPLGARRAGCRALVVTIRWLISLRARFGGRTCRRPVRAHTGGRDPLSLLNALADRLAGEGATIGPEPPFLINEELAVFWSIHVGADGPRSSNTSLETSGLCCCRSSSALLLLTGPRSPARSLWSTRTRGRFSTALPGLQGERPGFAYVPEREREREREKREERRERARERERRTLFFSAFSFSAFLIVSINPFFGRNICTICVLRAGGFYEFGPNIRTTCT